MEKALIPASRGFRAVSLHGNASSPSDESWLVFCLILSRFGRRRAAAVRRERSRRRDGARTDAARRDGVDAAARVYASRE